MLNLSKNEVSLINHNKITFLSQHVAYGMILEFLYNRPKKVVYKNILFLHQTSIIA